MTPTEQDVAALSHWWVGLRQEIDPDNADAEWATDYCWWPEARYVAPADFAMLPDQPYADVLAYGADLVRTLDVTALPGIEGAALGFDNGDLVLL